MGIIRKVTPKWKVHPGEILAKEFLGPLRISPYRLAKELLVSPPTVNDIVLQRRAITADMAARLAKFFGTTEQFWLNLQDAYDIGRVKIEKADKLQQIRPFRATRAGA